MKNKKERSMFSYFLSSIENTVFICFAFRKARRFFVSNQLHYTTKETFQKSSVKIEIKTNEDSA
jgi:hypothetical protein